MKALLIPIVAFLLFFAMGSGAGAYLSKPAAADSTHADSTHADSTRADSAHAGPSQADSSHTTPTRTDSTADSTAHGAAAAVTHVAAGDSAKPVTPRGANRGPNSIESLVRAQTGATVTMRADGSIGPEKADSVPNYARMASLLSKMGAREAARTVEQLSDNAAAHALAAMPDKQAALVLAQLPPDRAAALLQATLALLPRTAAP